MGIMQMGANLVEQVTTDTDGFAIPVIFSVTSGMVVVSKTCNAVAILHGLYIDERGAAVVSPTSRVMVSERALISAGYPTRDSNRKLSIKGNGVTFTDTATGLQGTFVIRMAVPNSMTGLITCTLGEAGSITPPGRTIIGFQPASIMATISATPGPETQTLVNGDIIPLEYSMNGNRTLTIPYMVSYAALSSFFLNGREVQDVQYTQSNGTFNNGLHGGFNIGNKIKFDASIPIWAS